MMKVLGPCEDETGTHFNFNKIRMIDDLLSLLKRSRRLRFAAGTLSADIRGLSAESKGF